VVIIRSGLPETSGTSPMLVSAGTSDTLVFGWLAVQRPIGAGPMISTFDCPYLGNSAHHRLADRLRNQQHCVILDFGSTLGAVRADDQNFLTLRCTRRQASHH
jgi:hypothetical protein